ncbi:MAG: cytochrome c biogenesis protein CcsA [Polyangiaceae bacterium]
MSFEPSDLLLLGAAAAYLAASVLFTVFLLGGANKAGRWAPALVTLAVPLHGAQLVWSSLASHACPVQGVHDTLSLAAMLAALTYALVRWRWRIDVVGAFVAPTALTFLLASRWASGDPREIHPLRSVLLPWHVAANLGGVALFTLASATAIAYVIEERLLKEKKLEGALRRFPPLEALDRAGHRFLAIGFPLLTLGVLTGSLWAHEVEAGGVSAIARAVLGYVAWGLFGSVLLLRAAAGWRGRRAAYGTLLGFAFTVLVLLLYVLHGTHAAPVAVEP